MEHNETGESENLNVGPLQVQGPQKSSAEVAWKGFNYLWAIVTLKPLTGAYRVIIGTVTCGLLILTAVFFYRFMWQVMAGEIYKARLEALSQDYEKLRGQFNEVVAESAVTELRVQNGQIAVVFRTKLGVIETLPTGISADEKQIYIEYAVLNGRLWIREIFKREGQDGREEMFLVNPKLAKIPWDEKGEVYTHLISRPLSEGRWVIKATRQGALTIERIDEDDIIELVSPPPIKSFEIIELEIRDDLTNIKSNRVIDRMLGLGQSEKKQDVNDPLSLPDE